MTGFVEYGIKWLRFFSIMKKRSVPSSWYFHTLVLVVLLPLFFWGGPGSHSPRSLGAFWDLGHVLFFMLFVRVLAGSGCRGFFWVWAGKMLIYVLVCGIIIEIIQAGVGGRMSGMGDVWRDLGGGVIGIAWVGFCNAARIKRGLFLLVVAFVMVVSVLPLGGALIDEVRTRRSFPLLSGFESSGELSRWQAKTKIARVAHPVREGKFSLRLPLTVDTYSGIGLKYFPRNWQGMEGLKMSIYNPDSSGLRLTFRVHDWQHVQGEQLYSDRFNRSALVKPGWNDIFIAMEEIRSAPAGREMDLGNIYGFGLFASGLEEERVIYIDDVRLVGDEVTKVR
jgi:VanZ family protein